jgi:hypothetical protein
MAEPTTTATDSPTPNAATESAPAAPAAAAPALPPDWTPERAEKAFKASRHQERKLKEREAALVAKERELESTYKPKLTQAERLEGLLARAKDGDEEALSELGIDYDGWTRRRLTADPVTDKLTALEKKLQERDAKEKADREQAEKTAQDRAVQQDCQTFAAVAHEKNGEVEAFEHLAVYDREELAQLAVPVAERLAELMGRAPTFAEMAQSLNEAFARRHEKIIARYEARRASAPPPSKAGTASVTKADAPAAPATLTNAISQESGTPRKAMTRDELAARRREIEHGWQRRA